MTSEIAARLLGVAGDTRQQLTQVMAELPVDGVVYRQIYKIVLEIDGLADLLAGDERWFHLKRH